MQFYVLILFGNLVAFLQVNVKPIGRLSGFDQVKIFKYACWQKEFDELFIVLVQGVVDYGVQNNDFLLLPPTFQLDPYFITFVPHDTPITILPPVDHCRLTQAHKAFPL